MCSCLFVYKTFNSKITTVISNAFAKFEFYLNASISSTIYSFKT